MNPAPILPAMGLPFGKHKGQPLAGVPTDYLAWALSECKLSSGVRVGLGDELRRRNVQPPPPPPPKPIPQCPHCGHAGHVLRWMTIRSGERRIRVECLGCGRLLKFAPLTPLNIQLAAAEETPCPRP